MLMRLSLTTFFNSIPQMIKRISSLLMPAPLLFGGFLWLGGEWANAGQRTFASNYEVLTAPWGSLEFENWVTWRRGNGKDQGNFRHEMEFGVTDRLQLAIYMVDWQWTDAPGEKRVKYEHTGVEVVYRLSNPITDIVGSAVYGEVKVGDGVMAWEGKLLLQKNLGRLTLTYNATVEAVWEGSTLGQLNERSGELAQTVGISYEINAHVNLGLEFLQEVDLPNWEAAGRSIIFWGPNISLRKGRYFATITGLFRLSDQADEPAMQVRGIFGVDF